MTSLLNPKPVCRSHLNTNSFKRAPKVAASWLARISVSLVFIAACLATFATPAAAQADITEFRQAAPTLSTNGGCIAASPTTWQILTRFVGVTNDSGGGDYVDVYLVDGTGLILSRDGVWIPNLVTTYNFTMAGTTTVNPVASPFRMVIYDNISLATRLAVGTNISAAIYPLLADITFNPYASDPDCPFYDSVAPVLTAFGRNTPTAQVTNADTLIFDITFNESVTGADVSDFAITGTTATASGALAGSGSSYRLTIAGGDLASFNGTVGLNLNTGHGITDIAGNALPNIEPATDLTFTLDNTAPSGYSASIDAAIINAANASSVSFSFSGAEIGAAFTYSLTDSLAASITGSGTISSATQNVSGIDVGALNDGDITLSVTLTDTASNAGSAAAAAAVSKDTTPPSGYTFVIDQDPINSGNVGAVSATFAGLEVGASYTYSLSSSGGGTPVTGSGTAVVASGTLPGTDASGLADGTITASITLTDAAGNTGAAATDTATKDTVAPRIVSILRQIPNASPTVASALTWRVTFDEAVQNVSAGDFALSGTTATIISVANATGNSWDILAYGGNLANVIGTVGLTLAGDQDIQDLVGNALTNVTPTDSNQATFLLTGLFEPDGAEDLVNTVYAGDQTGPKVEHFSDGSYVVIWLSGGNIIQRLFDANGTGQAESIVNDAGSAFTHYSVATDIGDGGYVVAWSGTGGVRTRLFSSAGTPAGASTLISATGSEVVITDLGNGGYVVGFLDNTAYDEPGFFTQRFNASAASLGAAAEIGSTGCGGCGTTYEYRGTTALIGRGGQYEFIETFGVDLAPVYVRPWVHIRRIGTADTGILTNLDDSVGFSRYLIDAAGFEDGTNVYVTEGSNLGVSTIEVWFTGSFLEPYATIETTLTRENNPTISVLTGGSVLAGGQALLVWQANGEVMAQRVGLSGLVGSPIALNTTTAGEQSVPVAIPLAGGGFRAVWQDGSGASADTLGTAIRSQSFEPIYDVTAPRVASITRQTPSTSQTNADSLTWRVTFDSAVTNITNDDFTATGTTGTVTSVTNPTGNAYDVTVSGGDLAGLDGTVTLGFSGGQNIADWAGNALSNTTPTGANEPGYSVNNQTPTIASITRQVSTTERTNADTLVWDISFSHISPLLSLNPGDFNLIGTTATLSLERYSTGFIATATGGDLAALNGVVSLFLGDGPNSDEFGNVVNPSPTGVTETYTVDNTPPAGYNFTIDQDPINTGNVGAVSVTFSGLEIGTSYAYSLSSSGGGTPVTGSGTAVVASGTLPGTDASGLADGTITASITLTDAAGNTGAAAIDTALKDTTPPRVASIVRQTPSTSPTSATSFTWRVTFDEAVTGVTLDNFTMDPAIRRGQGLLSINNVSATVADITASGFDPATFDGEWALSVSGSISDLVGNAMVNFAPVGAYETFVTDRTRPRIASIVRQSPSTEATTADSVTWRVTFDEAVEPPVDATFSVANTTGDVSVNNITALVTDVTVANGDMAGLDALITLSPTGTIRDLAGLSLTNTTPIGTNEASFTIDNTAPTGYTFTIDQDPINSGNVGAVSLSFSGFEVGTTYSYSLSSSGGGAPITGSGLALIAAGALPPADVSALPDGIITASVTLTDAAGNMGLPTTDTALKDVVAPNVLSLDLRPDPITISNQFNVVLDVGVLETGTSYTYTLSSSGGGTPITGLPGTASTASFSLNLPTIVLLPDGEITASFVLADPAGNSSIAWTDTATKDTTAPRIASIVRQSPSSPTNADSVTWRVTFDEPVSGVLSSDFQASGTTGSIAINTVSSTVTDVTVSGGDMPSLNGSVSLTALTSGSIVDALGNPFGTAAPTGANEAFVIDNAAPTGYAVSIDQDPIGPSDDPVTVSLTGLEIGTGYTVTLTSSGGGGTPFATRSGTATSATESPTPIYLNGHLPDGTVTASLTLTDFAGNIGAAAADAVVKDTAAPRIASVVRHSPAPLLTNADVITWRITFNEAVSGVTEADFSVSGTTGTIAVDNVSSTISDVSVSGGDMQALNGYVILSVLTGGITDAVGNALTDASSIGIYDIQFLLDNVAPEIRFISRQSPNLENTSADSVTWRLDGDALFNVTADDFVASGTTGSVSVVAANIYNTLWDVTVTGGDMAALNGTVTLGFAPGQDISDEAGNPIASLTPVYGNDNTFVIDNAGPRVVSILRSSPANNPTNDDRIIWRVVFDEPTVFSANDFALSGTTGAIRAFGGGSPEIAELWVDGGDMDDLDGLVTLAFAAGQTITDSAGNPLTNTTPTGTNDNTWLIDNTAPTGYTIAIDQDPMNALNASAVTISHSGFEPGSTYSYRVNDNSETLVIDGTGTVTQAAGRLQIGDFSTAPDSTIRATISLTDPAGNLGITVLDTVTKETVAPRLATILGGGAPTNEDSLTFAFQFDQGVVNVDISDFSVSGTTATVTNVSALSPIYYRITVSGGDLADIANAIVTASLALGHNIKDTNGNPLVNPVPTGASTEHIVNNSAPVGTFSSASSDPVSGDFTVNLAFTPQAGPADSIQGFGQNDILVANGTIQSFSLFTTAGITTGANIVVRPTADGLVTLDLPANRVEDSARNSNVAATQFSINADLTAPTLAITGPVGPVSGAFTATMTFSEDVSDFVFADLTVGNGAASDFQATSATVYTATITPTADGAVTVDVAGAVATDEAGNDNTAATQFSVTNDETTPTLAIAGPAGPVSGAFTATFTFDEDVSDFVVGDITVGNGAASAFDNSAAPVYTATITPVTDGPVTLDVAANVAIDGAGNSNLAALQFSTDSDGTGPTATITAPSGFDTLDPFVVTILFDEPVLFFTDVGEVTATHANVTAPSGSGTTYTATVTPDGNGDVEIGVLAQAALDLTLVNYNAAATPAVVVKDVIAPSVVLASTAGGTITGDVIVSASFTEAVADLTQSDFVITNGTASNFQQLTPGIYFILVTPAADGLVSVDLPAGAARDGLGNLSTAATPFSINADVTRPVPRFVNAPTAINSTAPFNVTVEFTEPVFFFTDVGEVAAFNASVSAPVGTGTTYVVTVTPNSGGNIYLAVIEGAALDGTFVNSNTGVSTSIAFDNTDPRLASVERLNPLTETTNADALTWRIRFDGTVQNVDAADFAVAGTSGSITSVTGSGNTFEVTASGGDLGFMDGVVALSLSAGQNITDTAGNALTNTAPTGAAESYTLKNSAPTLVIATTTAAPVLEAFPLTFTFNEDVTGFALSDISATNATIGQFQAVSATSYMAVATPTADGTITISVTAFSAEDALNNGNTDASLSIESRAIRPPTGIITALISPGARSGYIGGPQLTASAFVANSGTNPVADCSILIPTAAPVTMSWQQVDGSLTPVAASGASFDLPVGASASLIMTLTPTSATPLAGYTLYPQFYCRNASADPITGINTLFLAIGATPPPDILSSSVTTSGDGVIRIPSSGRVGFMSAAGVNIGGGDGSAGLNEATITVTADTGSTALPVTIEVCEIDATTAACITPRAGSTTAIWSQNENRFFAVFVRDASGGAGIPLDAANSRIYLRFTDATGTLRSITSAAVTAPAAAGVTPTLAALPTGRWSVLVREADGVWPSLTPSVLHVGPDGLAILDDGVSPRAIAMTPMTANASGQIGQFGSGEETGFWHAAGVIRQGDELASDAGDFWGVRDVRSDTPLTWADLAGDYGNGVFITEAGEIRGHLGGCSVYGAASGRAARPVALTLSGCETSGSYTGVLDLPANDTAPATLLIANEAQGWRVER